jgi:hypothetical protein
VKSAVDSGRTPSQTHAAAEALASNAYSERCEATEFERYKIQVIGCKIQKIKINYFASQSSKTVGM